MKGYKPKMLETGNKNKPEKLLELGFIDKPEKGGEKDGCKKDLQSPRK